MTDAETPSIEEMLKRCGALPGLIRRLSTDSQYAQRVTKFMEMASRHPVIYASSAPFGRWNCDCQRDPMDWLVP